ncbi:MAG: hypothetical protein KJZ98_15950 [Burkholderiaceae bacterium]|nr:hypothetical protein [Burkholderiaceae bacterium]
MQDAAQRLAVGTAAGHRIDAAPQHDNRNEAATTPKWRRNNGTTMPQQRRNGAATAPQRRNDRRNDHPTDGIRPRSKNERFPS